jgi:hypothetical protein
MISGGGAQDVTEENAEVCLGAKAHRGLVPPAAVPRPPAAHAPLLRAASRYYEEAAGVGGPEGGPAGRPAAVSPVADEHLVQARHPPELT